MNLLFDIFQGIGVALAIGIRPFFPSLAVTLLAAAGAETHIDGTRFQFAGTSLSFLQSLPFLLVLFICAVALVAMEGGPWGARLRSHNGILTLAVTSIVLAALLVAGDFRENHHALWLGLVIGAAFAAVGVATSQPFLARLRGRLDPEAAAVGIPVLAETGAIVIAVGSVLLPPLAPLALVALLVLTWRGRGRDQQKYAGLRILR